MIIDTFLFNDEFDMLDIRLSITEKYVDKWVILEGDKTWSGKSKDFHLKNNFKKYKSKYGNKIELISLKIPDGYINWQCENHSRASLQIGISKFADDDIIIHSDLDEILDPTLIDDILIFLKEKNKPISCILDMFIYRFDQKVNRDWQGPVVAKKSMFENPQKLYKGDGSKRKNRSFCETFPKIAGWHWTWIGNDERIKNKVVSCIESQHRNPEEVLTSLKILDTATAINHKCESKTISTSYPQLVYEVLENYPNYWNSLSNNTNG